MRKYKLTNPFALTLHRHIEQGWRKNNAGRFNLEFRGLERFHKPQARTRLSRTQYTRKSPQAVVHLYIPLVLYPVTPRSDHHPSPSRTPALRLLVSEHCLIVMATPWSVSHVQQGRLEACWRQQNCHACVHSSEGCGWCAQVSPNATLKRAVLHPRCNHGGSKRDYHVATFEPSDRLRDRGSQRGYGDSSPIYADRSIEQYMRACHQPAGPYLQAGLSAP